MQNYQIIATLEMTVAADQDDALRHLLSKIDGLITDYRTREGEVVKAKTLGIEIINQY